MYDVQAVYEELAELFHQETGFVAPGREGPQPEMTFWWEWWLTNRSRKVPKVEYPGHCGAPSPPTTPTAPPRLPQAGLFW